MSTLSRGDLFAGRFTVLRLVQEDARGDVYAARSEADQVMCRLRLLLAGPPVAGDAGASFAAAMAALPAHEAFPPVLACGVEDGCPFTVTRWIEGVSLADLVHARGRLPREEARVLLADLGAALLALHATGVGHHALLPELVMLDAVSAGGRLRPRILDAGTLHFGESLDVRRTDTLCFALIVHLALVGRAYREAVVLEETDYSALLDATGRANLEPPSAQVGSDVWLPEGFDAWFEGCLAREDERTALADAVAGLEELFIASDRADRLAEEAKRAAEERARVERERERQLTASWAALIADAGDGLVSYQAEVDKAVAGGVVFDLPEWVPPGERRSIVEAMVAAARALEGRARLGDGGIGAKIARLLGRGGERRYQKALEDLGIGPPVHATLDAEGLTLEYAHQTWVTSHEKGWASTPYARVPREALPLDIDVFSAMVRAIAEAASSYDVTRTVSICSKCRGSFAAIDMHDAAMCHGCAEIHLGIVH